MHKRYNLIKHKIMEDFRIESENVDILLSLPTSIDEIDAEYLKNITKNVNVAPHYTLVGVVFHETLSSFIMTYKQKRKNVSVGVIPIFIKCGKCDNEFINSVTLKDKLIIAPTQLSLGHQVATPGNVLAINYFTNLLDRDVNSYKKSIGKNKEVYFIEFKLVPNSDIVGYYTNDGVKIANRYVKVEKRGADAIPSTGEVH